MENFRWRSVECSQVYIIILSHKASSYHKYCQTDAIKIMLGNEILKILKTFITVQLLLSKQESCLLLQFSYHQHP